VKEFYHEMVKEDKEKNRENFRGVVKEDFLKEEKEKRCERILPRNSKGREGEERIFKSSIFGCVITLVTLNLVILV